MVSGLTLEDLPTDTDPRSLRIVNIATEFVPSPATRMIVKHTVEYEPTPPNNTC